MKKIGSAQSRVQSVVPFIKEFVCGLVVLAIMSLVLAGSASAQVVAMQDLFTYSTTNINGHSPTAGGGTWTTTYVNGSSGSSLISTNGTKAEMTVNGGVLDQGDAVANYAFPVAANTLYILQTTYQYTGPVGTGHDCWAGCGFSNQVGGGNSTSNPAPWMLMTTQSAAGANGGMETFVGHTVQNSGAIPAAVYASPITETVTWNTATGEAQYFVNGTLMSTSSNTSAPSGGTFYIFLQGFQSGAAVNVTNVTLSAQTLAFGSLLDNFDYVTPNLNGHAPTQSPAGLGLWSVATAGTAAISTDDTQAIVKTDGGTPGGSGQATAKFAFLPSQGMVYSLRATLNFTGPVGAGVDCWAGLGFASSGANVAPWMLVRPQGASGSNGGMSGSNHGTAVASGILPAADYASPVTVTVVWNTATGQAQFYADNLLLSTTASGSYLPTGPCSVFFQGFKTGNAFTVSNIALTAQPLPLPPVLLFPNDPTSSTSTPQVPNDILSLTTPAGSAEWATARSFCSAIGYGGGFCAYAGQPYAAQLPSIALYCKANNLQMWLGTGCLIQDMPGTTGTSPTCGHGEGYTSSTLATADANNLHAAMQAAGMTQLNISMDEPLSHGTGGIQYYPYTCNLSVATTASECAQTIGIFKNLFGSSNVSVSDTLSLGNPAIPPSEIPTWFQDFQSATGAPILYEDNDYNFDVALNPTVTQELPVFDGNHVNFGQIFGGGTPVNCTSNAMWMLYAEEEVQIYNAEPTVPHPPAHLTFATWGNYPTNLLPETGPTLSALVDFFFLSPYAVEPPPVPLTVLTKVGSGGHHFYSWKASEIAAYVAEGWQVDGPQCAVEPSLGCARGLVPLYRYYKASTQLQGLSLSSSDAALTSAGYALDGIMCYVFPDGSEGGTPLYAESYAATGDHYYTASYSNYIANGTNGWAENGIICYLPVACPGFPLGEGIP